MEAPLHGGQLAPSFRAFLWRFLHPNSYSQTMTEDAGKDETHKCDAQVRISERAESVIGTSG